MDRLYTIPCLERKALIDVPTWAETRHYLKTTSQLYSYEPTPFFREPAHYMSDLAHTSCVVLQTCSQCGKSLTLLNFLGWSIEYATGNTLFVLDSMKQGMRFGGNRLRPFIRDICGVNNPRNVKDKNPDKSNSVLNMGLKSGCNLFIMSAKSASDSKSTPAKYVLMDEVNAYPLDVNGEGNPVDLFTQRVKRFRSSMIIMTSTPTTEEGAITQNWRLGTAQTWGVICNCGKWLDVRYDNIDFTNDIPVFVCPYCGEVFSEKDIIGLKHAYNEPSNAKPLMDGYGRIRRSYQITAPLCHAFVNWKSLKQQEIAALSIGETSYKSFKNTVLGEVYKPKDEVDFALPDLMRASRTLDYDEDTLPSDIAFICLGIDTHDHCLYVETCGFSENLKQQYGIDYRVLVGDPAEHDVWDALTTLMNTEYHTNDGRLIRPAFAFCDSGGHRTNNVYSYSFRNNRFMPIKGFVSSKENAVDPLLGKLSRLPFSFGVKGKVKVQMIGVNAGKDMLAQYEVLTITGEQRLIYPINSACYNIDYFKGLISEKKIGGKWIAPSGSKINNEPLDCRVYAMACAEYYLQKYYLTGKDKEILKMPRKKKEVEEVVEVVEVVEEKQEEVKQPEKQPVKQPEKPKPSHPAVKPQEPQKKVVFPHW